MITDRVSTTVELLLTADPAVADRDELAAILRHSRQVQSWLDSVNVACARRGNELAAAGTAEPVESMLGDEGQRSSKESAGINKRVPACDAMPKFEAALAAGLISGEHVDVVATVLRRLDDEITAAFTAEEDRLLAAAQRESVEEFRSGCQDFARFLIAERDRRSGADTEMEELGRQRAASKIRQWTNHDTGMMHTHVELDPVRGAKFKKALADMLRRHRKTNANSGVPWNQLEVESFLNGIDRAVATRSTPASNGPDRRSATRAPTAPAASPAGGPSSAEPSLPDLRIPEIGVFIDLATLLQGLHEHGICQTYDGIPIPMSEVRRLCCDANIIPYVLNGDGEVTDLGRSTRTVNRAQRRKLRAMHTTCVGHGCEVPFEQCEIHHIVFWRFDGESNIDNLAPVCSRHHHLAHEGGWTLSMTPDRIVTWTRPDGIVDWSGSSIDRAPNGVAPDPPGGRPANQGRTNDTTPKRDPNRRVA